MQVAEQKKAAKNFSEYWEDKGYEKGQSQAFWIALLSDVLGVRDPIQYIEFEDEVHLDKTSFIDGYIPKTHVLIEQKGINKDLNKGIRQSDGSFLTPFQQAKRYSANLPYSKRPRWIVTSNFKEFNIYDMEKPIGEPIKLMLADLPKQYYLLDFLVDQTNVEIKKETNVSVKAGDLVGKIYDELKKQYKDPDNDHSQRSINQLCVRFVFCLYAEDAGIFGKKDLFHDYLKGIEPRFLRRSIIDLFKVLDTKISDRDPYLDDQLAQFPYVNGGLFSEEDIEIPNFTQELKDLLLNDASADFDWSDISPTIFGAVFESTLNPDTRREGGMHYTSIENIHKVIDPLFLDDLKEELLQIKQYKQPATLREKAKQFQFKLSKLTFFDPACGSGNFLTETYLSLRKLENEAIKLAFGDQGMLDVGQDLIKVSIQQFYGIEINDFAVSVAKTALWIAESQMMEATKAIVYTNVDFLPLKTYTKIIEDNSLRVDWDKLIPRQKMDYIMGNPPFIANAGRVSKNKGHSVSTMSPEQKEDRLMLFGTKGNVLDYVACWFKKAAEYMRDTTIHCAFVATNSIVQGQQTVALWKDLFADGISINFARKSFKWESEASATGTVFVVVIGFSYEKQRIRSLFDNDTMQEVSNINAYLNDAANVFIEKREQGINSTLKMKRGSQPTDGGNLILNSKEKDELVRKYPHISALIRPFMMGKDFINRKPRYCFWLVDKSPDEFRKYPEVRQRLEKVRLYRLASTKPATQKKALTPYRFDEVKDCKTDYIAFPEVSSAKRKYIPIDYLSPDIIGGNKLYMVENTTLYDFGVLTSNVHMAWVRATASLYGPSYSYSNTIVFNNFPWPTPSQKQMERITATAKQIMNARRLYPNSSLADLYDELTMPSELRKAHQENDKAVMQAYGMPIKDTTESDAVRELFKLYSKLT
jgi:type I restriction-modification system DNA methylase subunit